VILPGHRAVGLSILDFGLFEVRNGQRIIGIPGYLIETNSPDGPARILLDGGFPPDYAQDQAGAAARDGLGGFGGLINYGPRQTLPGQLALLGLSPADITHHILSHGHIDHVGALPLVCCPLYLSTVERADPAPCYFGTARPMAWPDIPTHRLTGDTAFCDGVDILMTPGHTPGHLSVAVTLPASGMILLAGDAINRRSEPDEGYCDAMDPVAAATSGQRLMALQHQHAATLVYGHDPEQWSALRKAPDRYL
jgi:N-acyl homoserine lactone hydrolase